MSLWNPFSTQKNLHQKSHKFFCGKWETKNISHKQLLLKAPIPLQFSMCSMLMHPRTLSKIDLMWWWNYHKKSGVSLLTINIVFWDFLLKFLRLLLFFYFLGSKICLKFWMNFQWGFESNWRPSVHLLADSLKILWRNEVIFIVDRTNWINIHWNEHFEKT